MWPFMLAVLNHPELSEDIKITLQQIYNAINYRLG